MEFKKKRGSSKQAWLDWLADDPPATDPSAPVRPQPPAQARQRPAAREYQTRDPRQAQPLRQPTALPPARPHPTPTQTAAPEAKQATPVSPATPATVSIQIHLPGLPTEKLKRFTTPIKRGWTAIRQGIRRAKAWFLLQLAHNKRRTIGITAGSLVVLAGVFIPPLILGGDSPKASSGASSGASAGTSVGYDKPPFVVVTPSSKTKLATPDGKTAAYDGTKNVFTFTDSIGETGIIVSQQPIPPQFADGPTAVESIGPTLNKGVTPQPMTTLHGKAYVSTNPKYSSQSVVFSIRDLLLFIQSSHSFKNSEWVSYINTLQ